MKKGVAEQLTVNDLSTSTLTEKIQLLLSDKKYKTNMVAASKAFRDQKDNPLERALWWIEWVMRNPNAVHFRSSGTDLSFIQIESIDVIAFLTLISVVLTLVFYLILKHILKLCRKREGISKRKND